ncbi:MAG: RNA 2',3'-cyclic phosphodiesterase [Deinococcales bacterium]
MSLRLFLALTPPEAVRAEARRATEHLRASLPTLRARYADPAATHLTLVFLGQVEEGDVPPVERAVRGVAGTSRPFTCRTAGLGAFPAAHRPSVLWLGLDDDAGALARLQRDLADALNAHAPHADRKRFVPHLTLARVSSLGRTPRDAVPAALQAYEPAPVPWPVGEVTLFRSELRSEGARHTALLTAPLRAPG